MKFFAQEQKEFEKMRKFAVESRKEVDKSFRQAEKQFKREEKVVENSIRQAERQFKGIISKEEKEMKKSFQGMEKRASSFFRS